MAAAHTHMGADVTHSEGRHHDHSSESPLLLKVEREVSQILHSQGKLIEHSTAMITRTLEYLERCLPKVSEAMAEISSGRISSRKGSNREDEFALSDVDERVRSSVPDARSYESSLTIHERQRDVHIALGLDPRDQRHTTGRSTEDRLREMEDQISSLLAHLGNMPQAIPKPGDMKSQVQTKSGDIANSIKNRDITLSSGLLTQLQKSPRFANLSNHHVPNTPDHATDIQQAIGRLADELACLRETISQKGLKEQKTGKNLKVAAWLRDNAMPQTFATEHFAMSLETSSHTASAIEDLRTSHQVPMVCTSEDLRVGLQSLETKVLTQLTTWPRWFDAELKRHREELVDAMKNLQNSRPVAIESSSELEAIMKALANSEPTRNQAAAGPEGNMRTPRGVSPLPLGAASERPSAQARSSFSPVSSLSKLSNIIKRSPRGQDNVRV